MAESAEAEVKHEGMSEHEAEHLNRSKLGMILFLGSEVMFFTGFLAAYIVLRASNDVSADQSILNWKLAALNTLVLIISSFTMAMAVQSAQRGLTSRLRLFLLLTIICAFGFMVIKYIEYDSKLDFSGTDPGITKSLETPAEDISDFWDENKGAPLVLTEAVKGFDYENDEEVEIAAGTNLTGTIVATIEGGVDNDVTPGETVVKVSSRNPIGPHFSVFFAAYYTLTGFHGLHVLAGIFVLIYVLIRAHTWGAHRFAFVECTGLYWHFVDVVWIFLFPALYLI